MDALVERGHTKWSGEDYSDMSYDASNKNFSYQDSLRGLKGIVSYLRNEKTKLESSMKPVLER